MPPVAPAGIALVPQSGGIAAAPPVGGQRGVPLEPVTAREPWRVRLPATGMTALWFLNHSVGTRPRARVATAGCGFGVWNRSAELPLPWTVVVPPQVW